MKLRFLVITVALTFLYFPTARTDDAFSTLSREDTRAINTIVESEMTEQELVGAAVGIVVDGEVAYLHGFGYENLKEKIPVTRDTMFRWASISKPVTAITAMRLWEQGKLDLDADVRTYVPEFPDKGAVVTARELLCHQGGIVHYTNGKVIRSDRNFRDPRPFESVIASLDYFKDSALIAVPGTTFSYSTHGYILLSAVAERAGGAPYIDLVRQTILSPADMTTMQPDYPWIDIPHRTLGYEKARGRIRKVGHQNVHWKLGGGGYISTIDDLTKFARGVLTQQFLKPETWELMWTNQKDANGNVTEMGLGFVVQGEGIHRAVLHSGSQNETRTLMVIYPHENMAITFMTNSQHAKQGAIVNPIATQLLADK
jgi:CubicO group peptidase (beta-lactamase class C family)